MTNKTETRQPTHRLYTVKGEGKNARWIEIGAAWANRDGDGNGDAPARPGCSPAMRAHCGVRRCSRRFGPAG